MQLKDICSKAGSNIAQKDIVNANGVYPIYGASGFIKNVDFYQQEKEYVAIVKDGAGVGRTMLLPSKSSVIGTIQYILPKENVMPRYLYYILTSLDLAKYATGATIPHIYFKDYSKEKVFLPTIAQQLQIAATLDKASELITLRKKQLEELDVLAESVFYDMFGDPVKNEKGWKKEPLENIVAKDCPLTYGIVQPGDDFFNGVPIVRPVDLTENLVKVKSLKLIDPQISAKFRRTLLKGGELLLSVRGTTGIVSLADKELNGCNVSRGITPIWFDNDFKILFAYRLFKCDEILNEIRKFTYGATLKQINLSDLRKIEVPTPPLPLQTRFAIIIEKIEQQKSLARKALQESEDLFQRLMQDLFKPD